MTDSLFDEAINDAAGIVNSVLGASCLYKHEKGGVTKDVSIIVDKNKAVTNEFGIIAGYRVEASILKYDVKRTRSGDVFVEPNGDTWRITTVIKETTSKWYVDVVKL